MMHIGFGWRLVLFAVLVFGPTLIIGASKWRNRRRSRRENNS
jgi:hypothetical protein